MPPWGLEIVNGALWVGNFGDGRINAYNPSTGSFVGTPRDVFGIPLEFDGLWGLVLTNGGVVFIRRARLGGQAPALRDPAQDTSQVTLHAQTPPPGVGETT